MPIPSRKLTDKDAALIRALIGKGWLQSDIASLFGCNSGRVAEIHTKQSFGGVKPADLADQAARARLAEIQTAWSLRMARQLSNVLTPEASS